MYMKFTTLVFLQQNVRHFSCRRELSTKLFRRDRDRASDRSHALFGQKYRKTDEVRFIGGPMLGIHASFLVASFALFEHVYGDDVPWMD